MSNSHASGMIIVFGANSVGLNVIKWLSRSGERVVAILEDPQYASNFDGVDCEIILNTQSPLESILSIGSQASAFISLTESSETNLAYCNVVKAALNLPINIARVDSHEYFTSSGVMQQGAFHNISRVATMVSQVELIAEQIVFNSYLRSAQESFIMLDYEWAFATLQATKAIDAGEKDRLKEMVILLGITREENFIKDEDLSEVKNQDIVHIIAPLDKLQAVGGLLTGDYQQVGKGLCIVGGGGVLGGAVASIVSKRMCFKYTTILEADAQKAEFLANKYTALEVVLASECNWRALEGTNIAGADLYIAISDDGAHSIASAAIAKKMGCQQTTCVLRGAEYHTGMLNLGIDSIIDANAVFAGKVISLIYSSNTSRAHFFLSGKMYCMETRILPGQQHLIDFGIEHIAEIYDTQISVVKRDGLTFLPTKEYRVRAGDRIIACGRTKRMSEFSGTALSGMRTKVV